MAETLCDLYCAGISSWGMKTWLKTPWMWQGSCTSSLASSLMTLSRDMSWSWPTVRRRGLGPSRSPDPSHSTTIIGGKRWMGTLWTRLRILQSVEILWSRWTICSKNICIYSFPRFKTHFTSSGILQHTSKQLWRWQPAEEQLWSLKKVYREFLQKEA